MKASVIDQFGPPEVFRYGEVDTPEPGHGEVLIRVAACGINRYDLYLRIGAVFSDIPFPHIVGADVAGTIERVGSGVTQWHPGDAVIAAPGYPIDAEDWSIRPENLAPSFEVNGTHTWGGYAEFLRIPDRFVLPNRTGLKAAEAAALPLVLMTAMHAVGTLGQVGPGTHVLVQAGASGSGQMCVQVARSLGGHVAATIGSPAKQEFVSASGAELVIDRNAESFADRVLDWTDGRWVDVVIDNVGASVFDENLRALRIGGVFVNFGLVGGMVGQINFRNLFFRQHQLRGSFMGSLDELARGLDLVAAGKVRPAIDRTYPLEDAAEAHRYIDSRAVQGKVLLVP